MTRVGEKVLEHHEHIPWEKPTERHIPLERAVWATTDKSPHGDAGRRATSVRIHNYTNQDSKWVETPRASTAGGDHHKLARCQHHPKNPSEGPARPRGGAAMAERRGGTQKHPEKDPARPRRIAAHLFCTQLARSLRATALRSRAAWSTLLQRGRLEPGQMPRPRAVPVPQVPGVVRRHIA